MNYFVWQVLVGAAGVIFPPLSIITIPLFIWLVYKEWQEWRHGKALLKQSMDVLQQSDAPEDS